MNPFIITDRYAGPEYFCGKVQAPTSFSNSYRVSIFGVQVLFKVYYFSVERFNFEENLSTL